MDNQQDAVELDNTPRNDYRDNQYWQGDCSLCGRKRVDCQVIMDRARSKGDYALCCDL
jgi:hypothetical protein